MRCFYGCKRVYVWRNKQTDRMADIERNFNGCIFSAPYQADYLCCGMDDINPFKAQRRYVFYLEGSFCLEA